MQTPGYFRANGYQVAPQKEDPIHYPGQRDPLQLAGSCYVFTNEKYSKMTGSQDHDNSFETLPVKKLNGSLAASPNYIRLINWAWEELPFIDGCKASHLVLFLAIVDSINRN